MLKVTEVNILDTRLISYFKDYKSQGRRKTGLCSYGSSARYVSDTKNKKIPL